MPSSLSRPSVLIVDDEAAIREALAAALADRYLVHTAASGAEAGERLRVHPIAAILLDVFLKDEHGLDLVEPFRRLSPAPIMLLTGNGSEALAKRAVWAGVDCYMNKPVSVSDLRAAVARILQRVAPSDVDPGPISTERAER
jgi:DNA-binding response OmpR family regulator